MAKLYITNAFSLSMLNRKHQAGGPVEYGLGEQNWQARIPRPVNDPLGFLDTMIECNLMDGNNLEIVSVIGHADIAEIMSNILVMKLPVNRVSIKLDDPNDHVLIGQYIGPRLPEGTTKLPDNATIEWWFI